MLELGFKINLGEEVNVAVSVTNTTRLKPPHGTFSDQLGYNQNKCKLRCSTERIIKLCGCRLIFMEAMCNEITYQTSVTGSKIASMDLNYDYFKNFEEKSLDFNPNNFLLLRVYLTNMQSTKISTVKAYSEMALLSDLGGALALILGSTFLTVAQIFDLIWNFCYYIYAKKKKSAEIQIMKN
ncbi:hypothetical protein HELRODRAFT_178669 [Helobdella robusta]|uniref:Uncharacterized protein n=1 Tax=Helobdella robusta TaxID=6412 RepID=T1FDJ4_HELRO|nr:hypothetical protein HELRODRAFT_178669 [Helobdella robusta]ESN96869.1 hypothetical protein HELRODRAFT_178669 [Helobdella robusta]